MKKIIVFRCKGCIKDLKEYNPYVDENGNSISIKDIYCIKVSQKDCENTDFVNMSIRVRPDYYKGLEDSQIYLLLDHIFKKAIKKGYEPIIKVWEGYFEREEGIAFTQSIKHFDDEFDYENFDVSELVALCEDSYGRGGCCEIGVRDSENEYIFYHSDSDEDNESDDDGNYIYSDINVFLN